jgi:hypothetical protein
MTTIDTWNRRRHNIRARVNNPSHAYPICAVLGCTQPTLAFVRRGLNPNYCRRHAEHYRRHGSYSKPSYRAGELNPYRRAAHAWLQAQADAPEVREAVDRVRTLYWRAGRPEEAFRLAGRSPHERTKYIWGRLHLRGVNPVHVLAAWAGVELRHQDDPCAESRPEFRRVQVAKVLHRLAGGSHKRWERERPDGTVEVMELHKYPASRGTVLRSVGRLASWAGEPLHLHLPAMRGGPLPLTHAGVRLPTARVTAR